MRIAPEHIKAAVSKLNEWGYDIPPLAEEDLVAEFDVRVEEDLRGGGQFRRDDPDTSKMAARMKQGDSRGRVLMAFIRFDQCAQSGLTNDELYDFVDPDHERDRDSWVPRVGELKRMGLVDGTSRKRRGNRNVKQQVNVISNKGIAFARQKGWS